MKLQAKKALKSLLLIRQYSWLTLILTMLLVALWAAVTQGKWH